MTIVTAEVRARPIEEILEEAEKANDESAQRWETGRSNRHDFLVAENFKQLREQWFLGNFVRLYNEVGHIKLKSAKHLPECQRPQPDFAIYDDSGALYCYIEVTEWLEPRRRRDGEYSRPFTGEARLVVEMPPSQDVIETLRQQLRKKLLEKAPSYPRNTWLLVDDNVGKGLYSWFDKQFGALDVARGVVEELRSEFTNISQVWLLREVTHPMTVHRLFP